MALLTILIVALLAQISLFQGCTAERELTKRDNCQLWTRQTNANSYGMTRVADPADEEACKNSCIDKSDCRTVDYIPRTTFFFISSSAECWHGYVPNQQSSGFRLNGVHLILQRDCLANPCKPSPCYNNGVCSYNGAFYTCTCPAGYSGPTCSATVNHCSPNPCANGGQCQLNVNGYLYVCACRNGFGGGHCTEALNPRGVTYNCVNHNPCSVSAYNQGRRYFKHDNPTYLVQCNEAGGCNALRVNPPEVADDIVRQNQVYNKK